MKRGHLTDPWVDRPTYPRAPSAQRKHIKTFKPTSIIWDMDDQGWAVSQGFYVAQSDGGRVVLIPLANNKHGWDINNTPEVQRQMLSYMERQMFNLDWRYVTLGWFIKQQDIHGYLGAWGGGIEVRDPTLKWYKKWHAPRYDKRHAAAPYYHRIVTRERERVARIQAKRLATLAAKKQTARQEALTDPNVLAVIKHTQDVARARAEGRELPRRAETIPSAELELERRRKQARERQARFRRRWGAPSA